MTASSLDSVPGLGEVRRKALLRRFGSLRRLRAASLEEIAEVPGIGRRTAEAILTALAPAGPAEVEPPPGDAAGDATATGEAAADSATPAGGPDAGEQQVDGPDGGPYEPAGRAPVPPA